MIRIKAHIPSMNDQCSWYRGAGPLNRLMADFPDIQIDYCSEFSQRDWWQVTGYDAFFILRPYREIHLQMIDAANSCQVPVIIDYDDDLLFEGEHSWLEAVKMKKYHGIIKECVARASWLFVSTPHLSEIYGPYVKPTQFDFRVFHKPISIIPNAFDGKALSYMNSDPIEKRNDIVSWRGSDTHDPDLLEISDSFVSVMNEEPQEKWVSHFYWGNPKFISYFVKSRHAALSPTGFYMRLYQTAPKILMHPLVENSFNIGKSNCAWIEGTMAGCMVIGRDLPEWRGKPNFYGYNNPKEFKETLRMLMHMSDTGITESVEKGKKFILEKLELFNTNLDRRKIFAEFKR